VSKSCFLFIHELRRIPKTLDYYTAQTIATSLIHSKVDYSITLYFSIFLAVNLIAFNFFSTPQLELFLKPSAISCPSSNLYTWLKIHQRIQYKDLSLTYKHCNLKNFPIFTTFSTFKLTLTLLLVHLLLSLFSVRQSTLFSKLPIDLSLTIILLSGTVFLMTFAILYLRRHLPSYNTQQIITLSFSPHLNFTPNLRLISCSDHSRFSLLAPLK